VACHAPSSPVFLQCRFEGNRVLAPSGPYSAAGGAFLAMDSAAPLIELCTFTGNSTDALAGAVFTGFYAVATIRRCVFRENTGHTGGAGVIQGTTIIDDCDFIANSAVYGGGLEISSGPSVVVIRSRFTGNSATEEAGGCRAAVGEQLVRECTFTGNQAPAGGALQLYDTTLTLRQCTIADNTSGIMVGREGSALPSYLTVRNSIISASTEGAALRCSAASSVEVSCTDIHGNAGGDWEGCIAGQNGTNGNFSLDPFFCAPEIGDFRLAAASPCAPSHSPPGCDLIGALPVGCATGLAAGEAPPAGGSLVVSPNPVRGIAEFAFGRPGPRVVSIFDSQGRLVERLTGSTGRWAWTPGASAPAGVYFARLDDGKDAEAVKFLYLR